jgi:hypothetical protein
VRVELSNTRHEELPAAIDNGRAGRRISLSTDVSDAAVLDDHGLVLQDFFAIHGNDRNACNHNRASLRVRGQNNASEQRQGD